MIQRFCGGKIQAVSYTHLDVYKRQCQDWGMQFRTDSYQKLSLILIQSFTKGGREAAMLMEAEEMCIRDRYIWSKRRIYYV